MQSRGMQKQQKPLGWTRRLAFGLLATSMLSGGIAAQATSFTDTYFFGSSFSDTGNSKMILDFPSDPPYFAGRNSNGPLWSDLLAAALGTGAVHSLSGGTNHAISGALSGVDNGPVISVRTQISNYLASNTVDPNALYLIRGGANDVNFIQFGVPGLTIPEAVEHVVAGITALHGAGAHHIMVLTLTDLPTFGERGPELVDEFNGLLKAEVTRLVAEGVGVRVFDVYPLGRRFESDPAAFGFTNVTTPCLGPGPCDPGQIDPVADTYMLYDGLHYTTRAHGFIAQAGLDALTDQTILGKKLIIKDPSSGADPAKRKIIAMGKEKVSPNTVVGDPTLTGADLRLRVSGGISAEQTFLLPQGLASSGKPFWQEAGASGFKYRDPKGDQGPVKLVMIQRSGKGFKLKVVITGKNGTVTVVPPDPGASAELTLTVDDGDRYCVQWDDEAGGDVKRNDSRIYKVANATVEPACPASPSGAFLSVTNGLLD